jgi:hypothetical protein
MRCDEHKFSFSTPEDFSCCDVCKEDTDFIDMHPKTCIDCYARMCHSHGDDLMGDEKYYRCDRCTLTVPSFDKFENTFQNVKWVISAGEVIVKSFRLTPTMITTYEFTRPPQPACPHVIGKCKCEDNKKITIRTH